jgi:hypothetical protein
MLCRVSRTGSVGDEQGISNQRCPYGRICRYPLPTRKRLQICANPCSGMVAVAYRIAAMIIGAEFAATRYLREKDWKLLRIQGSGSAGVAEKIRYLLSGRTSRMSCWQEEWCRCLAWAGMSSIVSFATRTSGSYQWFVGICNGLSGLSKS